MSKRSSSSRSRPAAEPNQAGQQEQSGEEIWVVLYCDKDDSHVLVQETDVIFECDLKIGDEVRFNFPQCGLLDGVVKGVSSDYSAMVKLQDKLNRLTKPRRNDSFHDDRPRTAALKAKKTISGKSEQPKQNSNKAAGSIERQGTPVYTDSESSDNEGEDDDGKVSDVDDNETTDDELSPEEENQLRLIMAKKKSCDMRFLKSFQKQPVLHKVMPSQDKTVIERRLMESPIASAATGSKSLTSEQDDVFKTPLRRDTGSRTLVSRAPKRRSSTSVQTLQLEGDFYNYKSTDPGVIKLVDEYEVFFLPKDKKNAKKCTSATSLARFLFRVVFTDEARSQCSVSGKPSKNPLTSSMERRPALDKDGVEAILDFVEMRCSRKNWPFVASSIKQSVGNMMCERREAARLASIAAES